MSPVVEEREDYEEFINENQEDNHTRNSTTNGGSNWRGNPYAPPPSGMFTEAEGFIINDGNFEAKDGGNMFDKTRKFTIDGGTFNSFGNDYDWQRNNPNFGRSEMFANSSGHTINDGNFTATGNSSGFANTSGYVINGGTFVAASSTYQESTHYQSPMNYGTSQGNVPPRPYHGQQGYDSRTFSLGYVRNPPQIPNELRQTSRPSATHSRSATLDRPFSTDTGSDPIRTAPIPPSFSEGQEYFDNRGEGRSNTGGGGRRA